MLVRANDLEENILELHAREEHSYTLLSFGCLDCKSYMGNCDVLVNALKNENLFLRVSMKKLLYRDGCNSLQELLDVHALTPI